MSLSTAKGVAGVCSDNEKINTTQEYDRMTDNTCLYWPVSSVQIIFPLYFLREETGILDDESDNGMCEAT